jgi:shikimate dehydrogenase
MLKYLLARFKKLFPRVKLDLCDLDDLTSADFLHDLVVNTTLVGMHNTPFAGLDASLMKPSTRIYDMVYAPLETPLLAEAKARGLKCADGLGMLAAQR